MRTINRNLFIVKPKEPFIEWINRVLKRDPPFILEQFIRDCTTYLIPESMSEEDAFQYIQSYKTHLFAVELNTWDKDQRTWPKGRTTAMFDHWFDLEFHSMIYDLDESPLTLSEG